MPGVEHEASAAERREALKKVLAQARACERCPDLAASRKTVVFGAGNADAELMFVGEAPGASEDEQGLPFVGRAGKLLDQLLAEIGMERREVFVCNTLKCLRYTSQVQLGDGSWERIGRLVRRKYGGEVMSVDEHGHLVPRKVVGWHATPLAGRRVYRLSFGASKNAGAGRVGVELTGDHAVLTERGYVPVEELEGGDRVATGERPSELIAPYVPESMRYKLVPEATARVPFEPSKLEAGPTAVMYDEVRSEEVTERQRGDVTFFCLDVEGTNNFVTAGGVVHNCRPPGNRDPLPIEIENCREYLLHQVELIQPSVICTLGNFSTKLLRGDPTGITRLHGQAEVITIGSRAVRLYPIYHPAAALYTPRMLETLREDFARLPELLALGAPPQPEASEPDMRELAEALEDPPEEAPESPQVDQLGLF